MEMNRAACELVRSGRLGKILEVRAVNFPGPSLAPHEGAPAQDVPKGLDWNMWLNQAAWRKFNSQWMDWMQWHDFSGGEMTNWGAHAIDQIQWALGMDQSGPSEITPRSPGRNGEVSLRYPNGVEVNFMLPWDHGPRGGAIFICEKGKLEINRNKFTSNPPKLRSSSANKSTSPKRNENGAIVSPSGKRVGTCRTGSTASGHARSLSRT